MADTPTRYPGFRYKNPLPSRCPARTTALPARGVVEEDPVRCALLAGHPLPHEYAVSVKWFGGQATPEDVARFSGALDG